MAPKAFGRLAIPLALLATLTLSGCVYSSEYHYEEDGPYDDCWMFCGDTYQYSYTGFFLLPFLGLLAIALIVGLIVAAVNAGDRPPPQTAPPAQQQVVIHTDREVDE